MSQNPAMPSAPHGAEQTPAPAVSAQAPRQPRASRAKSGAASGQGAQPSEPTAEKKPPKQPVKKVVKPAVKKAVIKAAAPTAEVPATELAAAAERHTLAVTPLIGVRPRDVLGAAGALLKAVARTPFKAGMHSGNYLRELYRIASGESELAPSPKDKRFADPAWQSNGFLRALVQSYLAGERELSAFIEASDLEGADKGRARFV
ncbi:MAG TPA: hypothetical protein VFY62_16745, partial [Pseudomonas sp.]|nr:hypothetical protein [Pseudomonas sp.]